MPTLKFFLHCFQHILLCTRSSGGALIRVRQDHVECLATCYAVCHDMAVFSNPTTDQQLIQIPRAAR